MGINLWGMRCKIFSSLSSVHALSKRYCKYTQMHIRNDDVAYDIHHQRFKVRDIDHNSRASFAFEAIFRPVCVFVRARRNVTFPIFIVSRTYSSRN